MWQRFTERARRVIFFAQEEAGRLGENYVSSEHLLLGLIRENDSIAARVLDKMGIHLERIRTETERQVTRGEGTLSQDMQLTPRAKRIIDLAYDEARQLNNNYIGTEHLLLGLVREGEGLGGRVLAKLGVNLDTCRREILSLQDTDSPVRPQTLPITEETLAELKATGGILAALKAEIVSAPEDQKEITLSAELSEMLRQYFAGQPAPKHESSARTSLIGEMQASPSVSQATHKVVEFLTKRFGRGGQASEEDVKKEAEVLFATTCVEQDSFQLRGKSLLSIADLTRKQLDGILLVAKGMERAHKTETSVIHYPYPKSLAMIFEKPSLRTRVTFELGMQQLGGLAVVLGPADIGLGSREAVPDVARNLERLTDAIMARVFQHEVLVELRDNCRIPIINGLSDREHPCQALADLYTLSQKKGTLEGLKLAWVGDGNNVLHSLLLAGALAGMTISAACPKGYEPLPEIVKQAQQIARKVRKAEGKTDPEEAASQFLITEDLQEAVQDADAVYTDVWTSMGQEKEQIARIQAFRPYQVNNELMALAKPDALFMHCLPAHRGDEVTNEVVDGPQSVVFDQAENRLHAQKAVLALLMGI